MNNRLKILLVVLLSSTVSLYAAEKKGGAIDSVVYKEMRDSVHNAFNDADSARFYTAVKKFERYLLKQKDLHSYYTQRCNEIVFELNRQDIYEAYKLACDLSRELAERKLDKEMYMAINMMGHIYNFSGNKESAKKCWWEVIRRMEQAGYIESQPPIYMNLVNILMDEDPDEALRLIDQAASIARQTSPEREFDIETRRTLAYYRKGDMERFLKGYKEYKEGEAKGLTSVHGRELEVYYLVQQGKTNEVEKYEKEREEAQRHVITLFIIASLLLMLVFALFYIVQVRRRHMREMKKAYRRALESDKLKTAFIQNVSHEVRTPLNVITGFAQVMANPENNLTQEERRSMADMMVHNTYRITNMINEVLMIAVHESATERRLTAIHCNAFFSDIVANVHVEMEKKKLLKLSYDSVLDDGFTIQSEERLLKLILVQLLDNAVKNTSVGTITLKASATDTELILAVEDTGCGVPPHEEERIFERFVKLDQFKEGLGIGLTFSRTMAQRLGGDVRLDTTYQGPGARFVVTIPLA